MRARANFILLFYIYLLYILTYNARLPLEVTVFYARLACGLEMLSFAIYCFAKINKETRKLHSRVKQQQ